MMGVFLFLPVYRRVAAHSPMLADMKILIGKEH